MPSVQAQSRGQTRVLLTNSTACTASQVPTKRSRAHIYRFLKMDPSTASQQNMRQVLDILEVLERENRQLQQNVQGLQVDLTRANNRINTLTTENATLTTQVTAAEQRAAAAEQEAVHARYLVWFRERQEISDKRRCALAGRC